MDTEHSCKSDSLPNTLQYKVYARHPTKFLEVFSHSRDSMTWLIKVIQRCEVMSAELNKPWQAEDTFYVAVFLFSVSWLNLSLLRAC